ncbi:hypothetical protein [Dictyobacter formicarum]|uniref:Uncharacterized protein n=1 Tax=Dictyobacter formicarum TaxID=2778368 RepID=A0ABQ3VA49_9CHLR|nr:hypothetical protein [Dictyobacter formicarum]GHO82714.1 hypothetical protein KSZ_07200 [Dictyobacter formicarum]
MGKRFIVSAWTSDQRSYQVLCLTRFCGILVRDGQPESTIAGVGLIGSHAMLGGDHPNCVSLSQAFLRLSL